MENSREAGILRRTRQKHCVASKVNTAGSFSLPLQLSLLLQSFSYIIGDYRTIDRQPALERLNGGRERHWWMCGLRVNGVWKYCERKGQTNLLVMYRHAKTACNWWSAHGPRVAPRHGDRQSPNPPRHPQHFPSFLAFPHSLTPLVNKENLLRWCPTMIHYREISVSSIITPS